MTDQDSSASSFTGRRRELRNRASVKWADRIAKHVIRLGGIGTIIAVTLVCVQLVVVVIPLTDFFYPASAGQGQAGKQPWDSKPIQLGYDEYRSLAWALFPDGLVRVFRLDNGEQVDQHQIDLGGEVKITCVSVTRNGDVALGLDNGGVCLGEARFKSSFPNPAGLPKTLTSLTDNACATYEKGILQRTGQGELRHLRLQVDIKEPVEIAEQKIELIDHVIGTRGPIFATFSSGDRLRLNTVRSKENLLTGEITYKAQGAELPYESHQASRPKFLRLGGQGDTINLAWEDGYLQRYDARQMDEAKLVEKIKLLDQGTLTQLEYLLGDTTLIAGDSTGKLSAWFRVRPTGDLTSAADGTRLVLAHQLETGPAAVSSLGMSSRSRLVAVGYADGSARIYNVTTEGLLVSQQVFENASVETIAIAPKDDGLFATDGKQLWQADFDKAHNEATVSSLFLPIWYEGYEGPDHVWQSGGGSEDLEPKLGLWPLVFGTLKATFYSMLIAVPVALLAAVYTSEFMHSSTRAKVKPTIELMASLPSVVLGFLAGLVFAPYIEKVVPAALSCFLTVPLAFLVSALVWQLLPLRTALRIEAWRLPLMFLVLPLGLLAGVYVGPQIEVWFFAGDMARWLDGQIGGPIGGWMMTLLPLTAVATAVLFGTVVNPWLRTRTAEWSRAAVARLSLLKFCLGSLAAFSVALLFSYLLGAIGFDARGIYLGTYDQRNALVVGFVMGFAVIPIIYTIADDALYTVPKHLRSGSLGAGATRWQTAVRIVIPTAMSGLFSAIMIGLGRAVGETMIVLMATGNTPVRDWNIFNGFRTLSANIAVELPEAPLNTTHYRTLFLAALTLFALTFVVNTLAEVVRMRFRRRAVQL